MNWSKSLLTATFSLCCSVCNLSFAQDTKFTVASPPSDQVTSKEGRNPAKTTENYAIISMATAVLSEMLKAKIGKGIADAIEDTNDFVKVSLKDLKFMEYADASPGIAIYSKNDVDFRIPGINSDLSAKCRRFLRVKIAAKPVREVIPKDKGTTIKCDSGQITELIMKGPNEVLRRLIVDQINKVQAMDPETVAKWE